jgi:hypothetical protein
VTLVAVALFFRETHQPSTTTRIDFAAAFYNISAVFRPTRTRILYLANFAFYLGIFGFFRCYPMYLVDEFHLDVSKVSEFIAWLSVPIIIGSLWLAGVIMAKFPVATVAVWSGVLTALAMILIELGSTDPEGLDDFSSSLVAWRFVLQADGSGLGLAEASSFGASSPSTPQWNLSPPIFNISWW